jgi:hypothetical protein
LQSSIIRCVNIMRSFPVLAVLALPLPGTAPLSEGGEPEVEVPEGLSSADWSSMRAAYEESRHAAYPGEQGYRARNPGQRWQTEFDGRGFTTRPDAGAWTWGLELVSYGFPGAEHSVEVPARVDADGARVTYGWHPTLDEWYLNDGRGLEHGYTVHQRPTVHAGDGTPGPLQFTLAVRGGLEPSLSAGARDVRFVDEAGGTVLTYSSLVAFDASGASLPARFEVVDAGLRLSVDDTGADYPLTIDPIAQQAYLKASNTDAGDSFGRSVSISGDTLVVGADTEDSSATGVNGDQLDNSAADSGAVYVFVRSGTGWSQQAYLKASNTNAGDLFGSSVSISGDTLVVSADEEDSSATGVNGDQLDNNAADSGAVYVFVRSGTVWSQQAYLKASNTNAGDLFGSSVSISGDTLVVGAWWEDSSATGINGDQLDNSAVNSGAAYVFVRSGTVWSQQAYLKASNTDGGDFFGLRVSISGETLVVGAQAEDSSATGVNGDQGNNAAAGSGAAYVFVRNGTIWSQQAYLKASNTDSGDAFGRMSLSGDTVVVGAVGEDSNATGVNGNQGNSTTQSSGAAYVFVRNGAIWSQQAYLKASNTGNLDIFGDDVSLSGDTVVVGARAEDSSATGVNGDQGNNAAGSSGAAYVFVRNGTIWSQQAYLKASNTGANDNFGGVAVSGNTVVVSAEEEDSNSTGVNGDQGNNAASGSGAAYVFDLDAPFEQYCHQSLLTSVPGCFAQLSAHDPTLATGSWDTTQIPRSNTLPSGTTVGIYIYTHGVGLGQSAVSTTVPYGTLCLTGFKRSSPSCAPVTLFTLSGVCNPGVLSLPIDCSSGALGLAVGEDVNVQLWYRDPAPSGSQARFSNAIFYTIQ